MLLRDATRVSILASLGFILMLFEVPIIPGVDFLRYDAGDIPVLIAAFALGPWKGVACAALKGFLYLMFHMSPDQWVGVPMNVLAGASFAWVAGSIYWMGKTKSRAMVSLLVGGVVSTSVMMTANLLVLPFFMAVFFPGVPVEVTRAMLLGTLLPFNLIKGGLNGVLCFVVYKRISPVLKAARWELPSPTPGPVSARRAPVA